jgi:hypothetical protein
VLLYLLISLGLQPPKILSLKVVTFKGGRSPLTKHSLGRRALLRPSTFDYASGGSFSECWMEGGRV